MHYQVILVANKIDLKKSRKISEQSGEAFSTKNSMRYIEASALDATNVETAFTALIEDIYTKTILAQGGGLLPKHLHRDQNIGANSRKIRLDEDVKNKEGLWKLKCCWSE